MYLLTFSQLRNPYAVEKEDQYDLLIVEYAKECGCGLF
jgi:hypothetical protein